MFTVYGITTCGTVKKARAFLDEKKHPYTFVDFRQTPPSAKQVQQWVSAFGAAALKNTSGQSYRALPEAKAEWTEAEWAKRFTADPMLIKRPVIERDGSPHSVGFKNPKLF